MALGGGSWTAQDKVLPGTYINFVSPDRVGTGMAGRGTVAVPLALEWGPENTMFTVTAESLAERCLPVFGYALESAKMQPVREVLKHAKKLLCWRLQKDAVRAKNQLCEAKYAGSRGNDLTLTVRANPDKVGYFEVLTFLAGQVVDQQTVQGSEGLVDSDYVRFLPDTTLQAAATLPLAGGAQGAAVTAAEYQAFFTGAEGYGFDILCCPGADSATVTSFITYTENLCAGRGANFQLVCYRPENADSEHVIGVENKALTGAAQGLVYWVAGAQAGCALGESLTGKPYDGELVVELTHSQAALGEGAQDGKFLFHAVNGEPKVLRDCNTLTTFTPKKGADFARNQTVRVCAVLAKEVAALFAGKYLGTVANDVSGRISLWNDICKILAALQAEHALGDFVPEDVQVLPGQARETVLCKLGKLPVAGAMEMLYMDIVIL